MAILRLGHQPTPSLSPWGCNLESLLHLQGCSRARESQGDNRVHRKETTGASRTWTELNKLALLLEYSLESNRRVPRGSDGLEPDVSTVRDSVQSCYAESCCGFWGFLKIFGDVISHCDNVH